MTTSFATSAPRRSRHNPRVGRDQAIGVVGATGAVGRVTLGLLRERGYRNVRAFASARSAGAEVDGLTVEEATPDALAPETLIPAWSPSAPLGAASPVPTPVP